MKTEVRLGFMIITDKVLQKLKENVMRQMKISVYKTMSIAYWSVGVYIIYMCVILFLQCRKIMGRISWE